MSYSLGAHYLNPNCTGLPSVYDASFFTEGCVPATCARQSDGVEYVTSTCVPSLDVVLVQAKATWSTTKIVSVTSYSDKDCTTVDYYGFLNEGRCYYSSGNRYIKRTIQGSQILAAFFNDNQCTQFNETVNPDTEQVCKRYSDGTSVIYEIQDGAHFVFPAATTTTTMSAAVTKSVIPLATSTTMSNTNQDSSSGAPTGAIIGGVCGVIVVVAAIGAGVWISKRNKKGAPDALPIQQYAPPPPPSQPSKYVAPEPVGVNYALAPAPPSNFHPSQYAEPAAPPTVSYAPSISTESNTTYAAPHEPDALQKLPIKPTMFDGMSEQARPDVGVMLKLDMRQPETWTTAQTGSWLASVGTSPDVVRVFQGHNLDGQYLKVISATMEACKESLRVDVGIADIRTRVLLANHIFNLFHVNSPTAVDASAPPSYAF
ncbi:hypothetical protein BC830DRAFT_1167315 [Chytriomyces sp. MP71]|nr:hypothetical protein BC830DRAFT_1167315 [Chytriomyces sp. MP71]